MKAILQKDRRRGGVARKGLALAGLAALGLAAPLAMLRPAARAQGTVAAGQPVNFEMRNKGELTAIIRGDGGYEATGRRLGHATVLFYRHGRPGQAVRVGSLRFRDAPGGATTVLTHTEFVRTPGGSAGSVDMSFERLGTARRIDALAPEQMRAIQNAVPDAAPRLIGPATPSKPAIPTQRAAPPQKYVAYDFTWAQVPGHPEQAVAQLKRVYAWMAHYRETHDGAYPPDFSALSQDMRFDPPGYGFPEGASRAVGEALANPDTRYTNMRGMGKLLTPYLMAYTRLDGTQIGSPKAPGTRDVLACTDMYVQQNWRKGIPTTQIGFYLVLWDDGTVERIPWNAILWVPYVPEQQLPTRPVTAAFVDAAEKNRFAAWTHAFPGQAGVPANALTDAQYHHRRW